LIRIETNIFNRGLKFEASPRRVDKKRWERSQIGQWYTNRHSLHITNAQRKLGNNSSTRVGHFQIEIRHKQVRTKLYCWL